jgi:hypothetical protein
MTVNELIKILLQVKDKEKEIRIIEKYSRNFYIFTKVSEQYQTNNFDIEILKGNGKEL